MYRFSPPSSRPSMSRVCRCVGYDDHGSAQQNADIIGEHKQPTGAGATVFAVIFTTQPCTSKTCAVLAPGKYRVISTDICDNHVHE
eukprot:m.546190 g.546190  ORF g.546190 m.546190 type:complete len:86 (+) comp22150_c0_seq4:1810-2067(+)